MSTRYARVTDERNGCPLLGVCPRRSMVLVSLVLACGSTLSVSVSAGSIPDEPLFQTPQLTSPPPSQSTQSGHQQDEGLGQPSDPMQHGATMHLPQSRSTNQQDELPRRFVEGRLVVRGLGLGSMSDWRFSTATEVHDSIRFPSLASIENSLTARTDAIGDALQRVEDMRFDRSLRVAAVGDDEAMSGSLSGLPSRDVGLATFDIFDPLTIGQTLDRASRGVELVGGQTGGSSASGGGSFHFGSSGSSSTGGSTGGGRGGSGGGGGRGSSGGGGSSAGGASVPSTATGNSPEVNPEPQPAAGAQQAQPPTSNQTGSTNGSTNQSGGVISATGAVPPNNAQGPVGPVQAGTHGATGSSQGSTSSGTGTGSGTSGSGSSSSGSGSSSGVGTVSGGNTSGSTASGNAGGGVSTTGGGTPVTVPTGGNAGSGATSSGASGGGNNNGVPHTGVTGGSSGGTTSGATGGANSTGGASAATVNFPSLVAGSGFSGVTTAPAQIGAITTPGWDAKAIARWDVVPFQTIDEPFHIGVIAFHINGIDRVEFSLDGGPWTEVTEMKHNPRTDVWEYTVTIDPTDPASNLQDGLHEVRARVIPSGAGKPRVLAGEIEAGINLANGNHSLFLSTNSNNSLQEPVAYCSTTGSDTTGDGSRDKPFRQPGRALQYLTKKYGSCDGASVFLSSGEYSWGQHLYPYPVAVNRWPTIRPLPNIARSEVVINSSVPGGMQVQMVALRDITVSGEDIFRGSPDALLWSDNCELIGPGHCSPGQFGGGTSFFSPAWWAATYFTNTNVSENRNGIRAASFIRNCYVDTVSGSPFGGSQFVVKSKANTYNNDNCAHLHGDVFHWFYKDNNHENFIIYNVEAYDFDNQGIFAESFPQSDRMDNFAIVNSHFSKNAVSAAGSWWEVSTNHLLLWHVSMPDQPLRWAQSAYNTNLRNVSIRGSVFYAMSGEPTGSNISIKHVHYTNPEYYNASFPGTDVTLGDPGFVNPSTHDYSLKQNSVLRRRISNQAILVPSGLHNLPRQVPTDIGAMGTNSSGSASAGNE